MYGATPGKASFANNCLLARRLAERDVRFVQLYHRDWDHHSNLPNELKRQCDLTDRPAAALVKDLKRLGLLDETLVIWGGEFGRTAYSQGKITPGQLRPRPPPALLHACGWPAAGSSAARLIGKTDDFAYNIVEDPVHAHDLQATILHCLGVDHTRLTYRSQGRDFRLTDVGGKVVEKLVDELRAVSDLPGLTGEPPRRPRTGESSPERSGRHRAASRLPEWSTVSCRPTAGHAGLTGPAGCGPSVEP